MQTRSIVRIVVSMAVLLGLFSGAVTASAAILSVPAQYATIQAAINAAQPSDEVVVADGVYTGTGNKNLDLSGKAITVRSASGDPAACIIDCEGSGRGFYFHSGETAGAVVEGVTIRHGDSSGVYCNNNSNPMLTNCTISGNTFFAYDGGGGISCYESSPTLTDCTISANTAYGGGGVYCNNNSSPTLTRCAIAGNTAYNDGGGVYCRHNSSPTLTNCTITANQVIGDDGGGMLCESSNPTLVNCTIVGNTAEFGGGVLCSNSSPTLTNCTITNNTGNTHAGGVYCWGSSLTLTNCTISANTSSLGSGVYFRDSLGPTLTNCTITNNMGYSTGGVCCAGSSPTLTNCTISGNTAGVGGGVYCYDSSPTLTNCILWGDTPPEVNVSSGAPVLTYCDIQGGYAGTGNINLDPLFVDPDGPDSNPATWQDNNYRLAAGSRCIDAGDPQFASPPGRPDLDGNGRIWDGNGDGIAIVDMGAYEFGSYRYGDLNCDGTLNGLDVQAITIALLDQTAYRITYPGCKVYLADLDGDGTVDMSDVQLFIQALLTP